MGQRPGPHASVLAQADQLAASGKSSDAEALYRFAIDVDPFASRPRLGLARAQAARGEVERAVDELVSAARGLAPAAPDPVQSYALFALALELAPTRLELHVDLAEVQAASGDLHGAHTRLAQLSMAYVQAGRHDDARAVLEFADGWDTQPAISGTIDTALPLEESIPILLEDLEERSSPALPRSTGVPVAVDRTATICTPTLLRDGAGVLLPNQTVVPPPPIDRDRRGKPRVSPARAAARAPAQPTVPAPRTKTGRARTLPTSTAKLRTLRARAKARTAPTAVKDGSLAHRLRKLSGLPK